MANHNVTIPSNLSHEAFAWLRSLAKRAKNEDRLDGYKRKVLYQAGAFSHWFPNRFPLIREILDELSDLYDTSDLPLYQEVAHTLDQTDPEISLLEQKRADNTATPEELFELTETYINQGLYEKGLKVLSQLEQCITPTSDMKFLREFAESKIHAS